MKYFAPGRVNLIGEHIDYNGGNVFPVAINLGTYGEVSLREDTCINLYSNNFKDNGWFSFDFSKPLPKTNEWYDYVIGVVDVLLKEGFELKQGFDLVVEGNIPNGSGLSSSASLEVLAGYIIDDLNSLNISRPQLALYAQAAENNFVGVQCGIMDQFIIANGLKDKALNLNCDTLNFTPVNADLQDYHLLVLNSKVKRGLVDSAYNERRLQCVEGLKIINIKFNNKFSELCQVSLAELDSIKDAFSEIVYNRVKHAITEQERVIASVDALESKDLIKFGLLMNESHFSLKNDYEVSCEQLDFLVDFALSNKAIGSRMTGAGFGGCGIALVKDCDVKEFSTNIINAYQEKYNLALEIYDVSVEKGVYKDE